MARKKKSNGKKGKKRKSNSVRRKCSGGTMLAGDYLVKCHWHGTVDNDTLFCPTCGKKL
jgi:hypothetical protein